MIIVRAKVEGKRPYGCYGIIEGYIIVETEEEALSFIQTFYQNYSEYQECSPEEIQINKENHTFFIEPYNIIVGKYVFANMNETFNFDFINNM